MFQVFDNGKLVAQVQTHEELFQYITRREVNLMTFDPVRAQQYIPSVFLHLAMNENDEYAPGALYGDCLSISKPLHLPRTVMIWEDGRLVDIRPWLPEIRSYLVQLAAKTQKSISSPYFSTGHKPRFRHMYRRPQGYKQTQMGLSPADAEEIIDAMGTIPDKLRKTETMDNSCCYKQMSRSWKENSKAHKSWQKLKKQKTKACKSLRVMETIWDEPEFMDEDNTVA